MPFARVASLHYNVSITITIEVTTYKLFEAVIIPTPSTTCHLFEICAMADEKFPTLPSCLVILRRRNEVGQSITVEVSNGQGRLVNELSLGIVVILYVEIREIAPCQKGRILVLSIGSTFCNFGKLVFAVNLLIRKLKISHSLISLI